MNIRRAREDEAAFLTQLTTRSKAYWGYDASFIADAKEELEFRPSKFQPDFHVYILESQEGRVGFCSLIPVDSRVIELHDLFIEPSFIGKGYGKQLWDYAVNLGRSLGFEVMTLTVDPNAEPFYAHQGAVRIAERPSPLRPNRPLPIMQYRLNS